jgi:hypothetical protein
VHESRLVQAAQPAGEGAADGERVPGRHATLTPEQLVQPLPLDPLRDEEGPAVLELTHVEHPRERRVVEPRENRVLPGQPLDFDRGRRVSDLYHPSHAEPGILDEQRLPEAPGAQRLQHVVAAAE